MIEDVRTLIDACRGSLAKPFSPSPLPSIADTVEAFFVFSVSASDIRETMYIEQRRAIESMPTVRPR